MQGNGPIVIAGDEKGGVLVVWREGKGGDGGFEDVSDFFFGEAEFGGIDAEGLAMDEQGKKGEENEEGGLHFFYFLRFGRRLPRMRAWMRSGQVPLLRSFSQAASMRRLWRTGR